MNNESFLAFLKIENSDQPAEKSSSIGAGAIVGIVIGVLAGISALLVGMIWLCHRNRKQQEDEEEEDNDEASFLEKLPTLPKRYSYKDLQNITQDFETMLGSGGFGKVYEGKLPNGDRVAVKKLNEAGENEGNKDFRAEVAILGGINHGNLVRLCGFCARRSSRLLVYEYMQHGSLDKWLFLKEPRGLSWSTRFQIALGTARGLAYLHNGCSPQVLHLDVKPQNILLDTDFTAKIADFGLSRFVKRDESFVETTLRGTLGYIAPERYLLEGVTEKADVYSFGIVLLQIVSRRKMSDLVGHITADLLPVNTDLTDGADNTDKEQAHRMILTVFHCIQEDPSMRPSMNRVVQVLEGTGDIAHLDVSELYLGIPSDLRRPRLSSTMQIISSSSSSAPIHTAPSGGFMSSLSSVEAR